MTELQAARNRKRFAAWRAKVVADIERFKEAAASVSVVCKEKHYIETEYSDPKVEGLALKVKLYKTKEGKRVDPQGTWFFNRPGRPRIALSIGIETHAAALKELRLLLAGDEEAIRGSYLSSDNNGVGSDDCHCVSEHMLLQEKTLEELEKEVTDAEAYLGWLEEAHVLRRRTRYQRRRWRYEHADFLAPFECRLRHLKAVLKRYAKFRKLAGLEVKIKAKPRSQEEAA